MAFAAHSGLEVTLDELSSEPLRALFSEEPGAVIQVAQRDLEHVLGVLAEHGLGRGTAVRRLGRPSRDGRLRFSRHGALLLDETRAQLEQIWSETSYRIASLRDHPECARQEYERVLDVEDPGMQPFVSFERDALGRSIDVQAVSAAAERPLIAIVREQGVNGQIEMAAAFHQAGFRCRDVHMSDLFAGSFRARPGGGARHVRRIFLRRRARRGPGLGQIHPAQRQGPRDVHELLRAPDSFTLAVCNGCQMLSGLKELIPGAAHFPRFVQNTSERFEARLGLVRVEATRSLFLRGMAGSRLPVVVSHGEGRVETSLAGREALRGEGRVALRFVDHRGHVATRYPDNPNGSPEGITAVSSDDGRVLITMPHPERVFRTAQLSWHPREWGHYSPWMRLFDNARRWVDEQR
jgi:phosphoribosylformylglycinamidine synthase